MQKPGYNIGNYSELKGPHVTSVSYMIMVDNTYLMQKCDSMELTLPLRKLM